MRFWIRKYNIQIEKLPLGLILWSAVVVLLCTSILSIILLLLPIQDKISGEVNIFTSGQPLSLNAPSEGFLRLYKPPGSIIEEGELIASIDVKVTTQELERIEQLVYEHFNNTDFTYEENLDQLIIDLSVEGYREIKNELYKLKDLIRQLKLHKSAADPQEMINAINKAIDINNNQNQTFRAIDKNLKEVIQVVKRQLQNDSTLLSYGAVSERELQDTYKDLVEANKSAIENNLRKQEMERLSVEDERSKIALRNSYRTRLIELQTSILDQEAIIRSQLQEFIDKYLIIAPIRGTLNLPYGVVEDEAVKDDLVLLLSREQKVESADAEMFVSAKNFGKVQPGQKVWIGLEEFDQKEFGIYYTTVSSINEVPQEGKYRVKLKCELPLKTSYQDTLPIRKTYKGSGEILLEKINLLTKISREVNFNKSKYALAN